MIFTLIFSRFSSRSATAPPTGSPKKRQLPLIPSALKERAAQDLEERARFMRHRSRQVHTYRSTGMGGERACYPPLPYLDAISAPRNINSKVFEYHSLRYENIITS